MYLAIAYTVKDENIPETFNEWLRYQRRVNNLEFRVFDTHKSKVEIIKQLQNENEARRYKD